MEKETKTITYLQCGSEIEATFVKEDIKWVRTHLIINGYDSCPFCFGFVDKDIICKSCKMQDESLRTFSNEQLEEFLEKIDIVRLT